MLAVCSRMLERTRTVKARNPQVSKLGAVRHSTAGEAQRLIARSRGVYTSPQMLEDDFTYLYSLSDKRAYRSPSKRVQPSHAASRRANWISPVGTH